MEYKWGADVEQSQLWSHQNVQSRGRENVTFQKEKCTEITKVLQPEILVEMLLTGHSVPLFI